MFKKGIYLLVFIVLLLLTFIFIKSSDIVNVVSRTSLVQPTVHISLYPVKNQGIIFKGLVTYGKGTQRNCGQLPEQLKLECEKNNKIKDSDRVSAQPTKTTLMIENNSDKVTNNLTTDGSYDYKISLDIGSYTICAKNVVGQPCGNVVVAEGKYVDFAIPVPAQ